MFLMAGRIMIRSLVVEPTLHHRWRTIKESQEQVVFCHRLVKLDTRLGVFPNLTSVFQPFLATLAGS